MLTARMARAAQIAVLALLLPTAYAAASAPFGSALRDVPLFAWFVIFFLSTLSGAVAMLNRVRKELENFGTLRWPGVFIAAHMSGSWLAGAIAFLLGSGNGWPEWTIDVSIILSSFGGAVFIEKFADKWLSARFGVDITKPAPLDAPIQRKFGIAPGPAATRAPSPPRRNPAHQAKPVARPEEPPYSTDFTPLEDETG